MASSRVASETKSGMTVASTRSVGRGPIDTVSSTTTARMVASIGVITVLLATTRAPVAATTASATAECDAPVSSNIMNGPLPFTITGTTIPP